MGILTRATRSLARRKTRTLIVTAALTLALMLIIILPPSINARQERTNSILDVLTGTARGLTDQVTLLVTEIECGYPISPELLVYEENGEIIMEQIMKRELMNETSITNIASLPDVVDVVPTLLGQPTRTRLYDIYGVAVDSVAFQKDLSMLPTNITTGRNLQLGDSGVIVIDEYIAKNATIFGDPLNSGEDTLTRIAEWVAKPYIFNVGDSFEILNHSFTIVGIEAAGPLQSSHGVTMSLADAQMVLDKAGQVSVCRVFVNDVDNVNSVVARIRGLDSDLEVSSGFTQLNTVQPMKDQVAALTMAAENNLNQIWSVGLVEMGVATVAAVAVILFMMLYSVRERTREIGTLKAMGASTSKVLGQFMLEGVLLSVGAAVVAILLSAFVLAPIASLILPVPVQEGVVLMWDANGTMHLGHSVLWDSDFFLPGEAPRVIGASLSVEWLVLSFGVAVLLGGLGSLYPALKAARTKPAEAMRYE